MLASFDDLKLGIAGEELDLFFGVCDGVYDVGRSVNPQNRALCEGNS